MELIRIGNHYFQLFITSPSLFPPTGITMTTLLICQDHLSKLLAKYAWRVIYLSDFAIGSLTPLTDKYFTYSSGSSSSNIGLSVIVVGL